MNQSQILQKLTGKKRLMQAFQLSSFVKELAILNIKEQLGKRATKKEISKKLQERLMLASYG